jgi:hypothetical protein
LFSIPARGTAGTSVALELDVKSGIHGLRLRSAVIARRRRRTRILAATSMLCLTGFLAVVTHEIWPRRAEVASDVAANLGAPAAGDAHAASAEASRPVFRHSIVPGGAYSRHEVVAAMRKDAVVAAHYQDIDVDKVHATTATAARAVYVSYRIGDRVYWTKNRVRLAAGETLLTDGETEIRARCGNLLSDDAQQPVAAEEPPVALLDEAEPETGSSTIADARDDESRLAHVPFLAAWSTGAVAGRDPVSTTRPPVASFVPPGGPPHTRGDDTSGRTTTGDVTTGNVTTGFVTTGDVTTGDVTSGDVTTGEVTTGDITTGDATTGDVTTGDVTTGNVTSGVVTTSDVSTTGQVTTGDIGTTGSVPEPTLLVLLGCGACSAAARKLRRRRDRP